MTQIPGAARPTLVIGRGASDAGGAASLAAARLRHAWALGPSPAPAADAAAGAEAALAGRLAAEGTPVLLLLAQAGRASHRMDLPLRVDTLPGSGGGAVLLVTVPAYASHAPQPAAAIRLIEAAARLLGGPGADRALHEDAEAWRRGADELATRDPRVAGLVREWEHRLEGELPGGDEIADGLTRLLDRA